jgi:hypothetical protein
MRNVDHFAFLKRHIEQAQTERSFLGNQKPPPSFVTAAAGPPSIGTRPGPEPPQTGVLPRPLNMW